MMQAIRFTVEANNKKDGYCRPIVTPAPARSHRSRKCSDPQVIVIVDDISLYPADFYESAWRSPRSRRSAITQCP